MELFVKSVRTSESGVRSKIEVLAEKEEIGKIKNLKYSVASEKEGDRYIIFYSYIGNEQF